MKTVAAATVALLALAGCGMGEESEPVALPESSTAAPSGPPDAIATSGSWDDIDWDKPPNNITRPDGEVVDLDEVMGTHFAEMACVSLASSQFETIYRPIQSDVQHNELHEGWYMILGFVEGSGGNAPTYQFTCLHRDDYSQLTEFNLVQSG